MLDALEATNPYYGFPSSTGKTDLRKKPSSENGWWLRSPHDRILDRVGYIQSDGSVNTRTINWNGGVSPALNIRLSSILYASWIHGDTYKLTLRDSGITLNAGEVSRSGNRITVPYTVGGSRADTVNRISVIQTDKKWTDSGWSGDYEILSYEMLELNGDGTGSFDLITV